MDNISRQSRSYYRSEQWHRRSGCEAFGSAWGNSCSQRKTSDRSQKLAKEFQDSGGKAPGIAMDVTQRDQVKGRVDSTVE
jgi:hypothetical protein